jgi:MurNAc alpha-1-phosphate uridylyltransferase
MVDTAMVLAAGLGRRMKPITDTLPKPLVPLAGVPMIDRGLDLLVRAGVRRAVVNLHYLGTMIEAHLSARTEPKVIFSWERDGLLETGGGIAKSLGKLGRQSFYAVNADIAWTDGDVPALTRLRRLWQPEKMDALLLLSALETATGYDGIGDFHLHEGGHLSRRISPEGAPYVFCGVQILHPRLFQGAPKSPFPLTVLYDRAQESRRLFGLIHDGEWYHIGTPEGLREAEGYFARKGRGVG